MKKSKGLLVLLAAGLMTAGLFGCEREGPAERAGERVDETVERGQERVDRAVE